MTPGRSSTGNLMQSAKVSPASSKSERVLLPGEAKNIFPEQLKGRWFWKGKWGDRREPPEGCKSSGVIAEILCREVLEERVSETQGMWEDTISHEETLKELPWVQGEILCGSGNLYQVRYSFIPSPVICNLDLVYNLEGFKNVFYVLFISSFTFPNLIWREFSDA